MRHPRLIACRVTTATTYHFRCHPDDRENRDFGWALCTVNDSTGELSIQSDWGSWTHRWSPDPRHLGALTLTHFLGDRASCDYLANKLSRESGTRSGEEFDADETVAKLRRRLSERRLEEARAWIEYYRDDDPGVVPDVLADPPSWAAKRPYSGGYHDKGEPLTKGNAREIWEALGSLEECGRSADLFCERFFQIRGHEWITDEPWEHAVYAPTAGHLVLLNSILPALVVACAEQVTRSCCSCGGCASRGSPTAPNQIGSVQEVLG